MCDSKNNLINYVTYFPRKTIRISFTSRRTILKFWVIAIFTVLLLIVLSQMDITPVRSQIINLPEAVQQTPSLNITQAGNLDISKVELDGQLLFRVAAPSTKTTGSKGSSSPIERRVKTIEFHLSAIVRHGFDPKTLKVTPLLIKNKTIIVASGKDWGPREILTVTPYDVELDEPGTIEKVAERWSKIIEEALIQAWEQRQPKYLKQQIPFVLAILAAMGTGILCIRTFQKFRDSIRRKLEQQHHELGLAKLNFDKTLPSDSSADQPSLPQEQPKYGLRRYLPHLTIEQEISLNVILRRVLFAINFAILFFGMAIIFKRFPQTHAFGDWLIRVPLAYLGIPIGVTVLKSVVDTLIQSNVQRIADRIRESGNADIRLRSRAQTIVTVLEELTGYLATLLGLILFFYTIKALQIILIAIGAIAFLSQGLLRDFLQTYFILVEDHYALGDWIQIGAINGQVEKMTLRTSQVRARCGDLFTISHGSFTEVTNFSHRYSGIDLFIDVAYGTDLDRAITVIEQVAKQMQQQDSLWGKYITAVKMKGVENFGDNSITIRLILHTEAAKQWDVGREYRLRLKSAFDQAGIEIPFPQHSIWFKNALIKPNTGEN